MMLPMTKSTMTSCTKNVMWHAVVRKLALNSVVNPVTLEMLFRYTSARHAIRLLRPYVVHKLRDKAATRTMVVVSNGSCTRLYKGPLSMSHATTFVAFVKFIIIMNEAQPLLCFYGTNTNHKLCKTIHPPQKHVPRQKRYVLKIS